MTDLGEEPFRALSDEEQMLLVAACEPFRPMGQVGDGTKWPVWDFIARAFAQKTGNTRSPEEVLADLPSGVSLYPDRRPYRLYWLSEIRHGSSVGDLDTFGLTIAGMYALREKRPVLGALADALANYIGDLARTGQQLTPTMFEAASWDAPFSDFSGIATPPDRSYPITLKAPAVAKVLEHESAMLSVRNLQQGWSCKVSGRSLWPFVSVRSASDYLAIAWNEPAPTAQTVWSSPLTLIQTIDYFGYVLEGASGWPKALGHPVRPRSFTAAASLGLSATTREEFESRISGLSTVIDHFTLPELPREIKRKDYGDSDGSINRLNHFLREHITTDPYRTDAEDAITALRSVKHLRVGQQHNSAGKRSTEARARELFGLSPVTESWESDWDRIRVHVAGAFTKIIEALQATEQP